MKIKHSVWIYGMGIGWWLQNEGYDNIADAAGELEELIGTSDITGGAIVPDGKFPMPMCDECLKRGRMHSPKTSAKPKKVKVK